jgi:hypothetical protein
MTPANGSPGTGLLWRRSLMSWFWLNMPLGAVFFLAGVGIPLWMVLRHPDSRPSAAQSAAAQFAAWQVAAPQAVAAYADRLSDATPLSVPVVVPMPSGSHSRRELAGASSAGRA